MVRPGLRPSLGWHRTRAYYELLVIPTVAVLTPSAWHIGRRGGGANTHDLADQCRARSACDRYWRKRCSRNEVMLQIFAVALGLVNLQIKGR